MAKRIDVEAGQRYVHEKGDRLIVRSFGRSFVMLEDSSGAIRRTTRKALKKHYKLTEATG